MVEKSRTQSLTQVTQLIWYAAKTEAFALEQQINPLKCTAVRQLHL